MILGRMFSLNQTLVTALLTCLGAGGLGVQPVAGQDVDLRDLSAMRARSIGPAGMSGRVTAIAASEADPSIVYVGAATGGVWRTKNDGVTWVPVLDGERVLGVGAIAVHPKNPDVVWVGTGEGNPRNSAGVGAGIYKSLDGGETWTFLGLEGTERIHRIVLDSRDTGTALVGALGPAWSDSEDRGVFRTADGGRTWTKVLYVDERTGVSDMVSDPYNPDHLLAGLWSFRRSPWFFESGSEAGGVFSSFDGGLSWRKITSDQGMLSGATGRIGLSFAENVPGAVYALIEADTSVLLTSKDAGRTWDEVSRGRDVNPRPFYYTDIQVDPDNELRLFNLHSRLEVSEDGGASFRTVGQGVHPDFQAIWVPSDRPKTVWVGTDGGLFISHDRGETWRFVDNLPLGQFYHVSVDMDRPFNVYGGMQDNGSWRGPSSVWENGGIRNYHWEEVGFGDGFNTIMDPSSPFLGYSMSQGGRLRRFDLRTGERKEISPWAPDTVSLRFNWNAPLALDPHKEGALYFGSHMVHRSPDRGETWQIISGDLTSNNPDKQRQAESGGLTPDNTGAESHTTILTIAPSPRDPEVVWVGTDDGRIHVTRTGGGEWFEVGRRIRGVPDDTWVPHIEASKHDPAVAYVLFDDHRRGNWQPYAYRTDNYGRDWARVADRERIDGFIHTLEEDPVDPQLLYLGTEMGLYLSMNQGDDWVRWEHGVPRVPVRSLVVHPRDHDLVIGTHGRAAFVVDDVRPLRELARDPSLTERPVHLFQPPEAFLVTPAAVDGYHFPGDAMYQGENRPHGALLSYWVGAAGGSEPLIFEVRDLHGELVRTWEASPAAGLQRVSWDLRGDPIRVEGEPVPGSSLEVLPSTYTVTLTRGEFSTQASLDVRPDPRVEIDLEDRVAKHQAMEEVRLTTATLSSVRDRIGQVSDILSSFSESTTSGAQVELLQAVDETTNALEDVRDRMRGLRVTGRIGSSLSSSRDRPTEAQRVGVVRYRRAVEELADQMDRLIVGPLSDLVRAAEAAGVDLIHVPAMVMRLPSEPPG